MSDVGVWIGACVSVGSLVVAVVALRKSAHAQREANAVQKDLVKIEERRDERNRQDRIDITRYRIWKLLSRLHRRIQSAVEKHDSPNGRATPADPLANPATLKLVLSYQLQPLVEEILDELRRCDDLPEIHTVSQVILKAGCTAQEWLGSVWEAMRAIEKVMAPELTRSMEEQYRQLPEAVRRVIEEAIREHQQE